MVEQEQVSQFAKYIGIALATLLMTYAYCRYKLNYWKRLGVQQFRKTNLIFGDYKNGVLLRTAPAYHLADLYREAPKNAPYMGFYIFHKPCLLLMDPKLVKQVLVRDFNTFYDRYFAGSPQMDSFGLINLFGMRDPLWRFVRTKTVPTFSRKNLKKMVPLLIETAGPMMEFLKNKTENDRGVKDIDAQDLMYKYASDIVGNVAIGVKTDSFKNLNSEYTRFRVVIGRIHVKVVLSQILSEFEVYKDPKKMYDLDKRSTFTASSNGINVEFKRLAK